MSGIARVWRFLWRFLASLLLVVATIVSWGEIESTRASADNVVAKYEQLAEKSPSQVVVRHVKLESTYQHRALSKGKTRYEIHFNYRDLEGRTRRATVPTLSLPQSFARQPVYFLKSDPSVNAIDVDYTLSEMADKYSGRVTTAWAFFLGSLALTLLLLANWWLIRSAPAGPVAPQNEDLSDLDTRQDLTVPPATAQNGAELRVRTAQGDIDLKIPPGAKNGLTLRVKNHGHRSKLDPNVVGDAYIRLIFKTLP